MKVVVDKDGRVLATMSRGNIDEDAIKSAGGYVIDADASLEGKRLKFDKASKSLSVDTPSHARTQEELNMAATYHEMYLMAEERARAKGLLKE